MRTEDIMPGMKNCCRNSDMTDKTILIPNEEKAFRCRWCKLYLYKGRIMTGKEYFDLLAENEKIDPQIHKF